MNSINIYLKNSTSSTLILPGKLKQREYFPILPTELRFTQILTSEKNTARRENYRPTSINLNIPSKSLANCIQQYIERKIHHNQMGFDIRNTGLDLLFKNQLM